VVTGIYAANTLVSIVNPSSSFTPAAPYSTYFPTVFQGTTSNVTGATGGNIVNVGNVYVTSGGNATLNITSTGANVTGYTTVSGNITGGNVLTAGLISATGTITGGNIATGGNINAGGLVSVTGNITGGNLSVSTGTVTVGNIVNSNGNGVGNIGSSSTWFNTLFATAIQAKYADVAERFAADEVLDAGTVVELGGAAEITKSRQDLSDKVFGVISTQAAYLMNGAAGTDNTHPPVAMTGRVPVQVIGAVKKGDRLVSAGNGQARSAKPGEATAFNVIGRALVDKTSTELGMVEAIVTIK
jgi:hypothetical protein